MENNDVGVQLKTFNELKELKITIPDFQRSYVWTIKNLEKIISDFEEFLLSKKDEYYMGTILLYEKNENYEIIDGQQRITTLTIMYHEIDESFPENFTLAFSSQESINNIIKAKNYFTENIGRIKKIKEVFNKLKFTTITTKSQDEAFTFFDTQNSRGVKLKAIDLLKSHHLRAVADINKQGVSAKKWENVENTKEGFLRPKKDFIDELFKYVLYRSRVWKGNNKKRVTIESSDRIQNEKIKDEFEKGENTNIIQLYPHHKNMSVFSLDIDDNAEYVLDFRWKQYRHTARDLPFSLRQPVSKGLEFFLYVEKYAQIVEYLYSDNQKISEYREFYKEVIDNGSFSIYLRELFILCVVSFYDKFEHDKLIEFSLWLEYILGAIRLNKSIVTERTIPKVIREMPYNIIDIILGAYTPLEVIDFLKSIKKIGDKSILEIYKRDISVQPNKSELIEENTIRNRYIKSILTYYKQKEEVKNLSKKREWIKTRIEHVTTI